MNINAANLRNRGATGFTLLEVMIASAIFFMAIFAILSLVSANLRNARILQQQSVNAGILMADYCQTNKLEERSYSGDFRDFGKMYDGFTWNSETVLASSNGLFKVDYVVTHPGGRDRKNYVSTLSAFLYRPDSPTTPGVHP